VALKLLRGTLDLLTLRTLDLRPLMRELPYGVKPLDGITLVGVLGPMDFCCPGSNSRASLASDPDRSADLVAKWEILCGQVYRISTELLWNFYAAW